MNSEKVSGNGLSTFSMAKIVLFLSISFSFFVPFKGYFLGFGVAFCERLKMKVLVWILGLTQWC